MTVHELAEKLSHLAKFGINGSTCEGHSENPLKAYLTLGLSSGEGFSITIEAIDTEGK